MYIYTRAYTGRQTHFMFDDEGEDIAYYASIHKMHVFGNFFVEAFLKLTANSIQTNFSMYLQYFQKEAAHQQLQLVSSPPIYRAAQYFKA